MSTLTLVIGNKNYSSWSLRPWLLMRQAGIPFNEVRVPLYQPDSTASLSALSPSGLVPVLHDGDLRVWDSLAICEYLNESFPGCCLWPDNAAKRAIARSVSAEMHAGFLALRSCMSMNLRGHYPDEGRTPECLQDIARIVAIWNECRQVHGSGGAFLFGRFSIADAMYAPVVLRFQIYAVPLEGDARAYADNMLALPALQEWVEAGVKETERVAMFDMYDTDAVGA
jgi:glutathione S-transferase